MVVFDVNSAWNRAVRRATVVAMTSVSLLASECQYAFAEKPSRSKVPKIAESAEPKSSSSFDDAIRKLLKEAKTAETKGEIDRAVFLAERAAKISESSSELVKSSKDVSPAATASYARILRQKRAELLAKQKATESAREVEIAKSITPTKVSPAPQIAESAPRQPAAAARASVTDLVPAVPTVNVAKSDSQQGSSSVATTEELPPAPIVTPRSNTSMASNVVKKRVAQTSQPVTPASDSFSETASGERVVVQSSAQDSEAGQRRVMAISKKSADKNSQIAATTVTAATSSSEPSDTSAWDSEEAETVAETPVEPSEKLTETIVSKPSVPLTPDSDRGVDEKFELPLHKASKPASSIQVSKKSGESAEGKTIPAREEKQAGIAKSHLANRNVRAIKDIREAIYSDDATDSPASNVTTPEVEVANHGQTDSPPVLSSFKLRQRPTVDLRSTLATEEKETSAAPIADTSLERHETDRLEDSSEVAQSDFSKDPSTAESISGSHESVAQAEAEVTPPFDEQPVKTSVQEPVSVKVRPAFRETTPPSAVENQKEVLAANSTEKTADTSTVEKPNSALVTASEAVVASPPAVAQPFRLRKSYRDRQTGELASIPPERSSAELVASTADSENLGEPTAASDSPATDKEVPAPEEIVTASQKPASFKVRSSFRSSQSEESVIDPAAQVKDSNATSGEELKASVPQTASTAESSDWSESEAEPKPIALSPFKLRSRTERAKDVIEDRSEVVSSESSEPSKSETASETTAEAAVDPAPAWDQAGAKQPGEVSPPIKLSPFKLRSRSTSAIVSTVQQPAETEQLSSTSSSGKPASVEGGTRTSNAGSGGFTPSTANETIAAKSTGTIKLRSAFRDSQVTTSGASDAKQTAAVEVADHQPIVAVKHELPSDTSDNVADDGATASVSQPAPKLKLRPAFRDPKQAAVGAPTTTEVKAATAATAAAEKAPISPAQGSSSMIQWRSKKSGSSSGTSVPPKKDSSITQTVNPSRPEADAEQTLSASVSSSDTKEPTLRMASHKRINRAPGDTSAGEESNSSSSSKTTGRELRASLWDAAPVPADDESSAVPTSASTPGEKAPLPPRSSRLANASGEVANRDKNESHKASSQTSKASAEASNSPVAASESADKVEMEGLHSSQSRKKQRPVAYEDDHAASTRAIFASGPIQRLSRMTGIPLSSASALVAAFGMIMLMGGLWMVRATMGSRQP